MTCHIALYMPGFDTRSDEIVFDGEAVMNTAAWAIGTLLCNLQENSQGTACKKRFLRPHRRGKTILSDLVSNPGGTFGVL